MKMKFKAKVFLTALGLLTVAGCAQKPKPTVAPKTIHGLKKTILVLPSGNSGAYWKQFRQGAEQAAREDDYHLLWDAPPVVWNPARQDERMLHDTNLHPSGIVIAPLHRNLVQTSITNAVTMNIPVVIADSEEDTAMQLSFVGSDSSAMGMALAQWVGKLTAPPSTVAIVGTPTGMRSIDMSQHALQQTLAQSFPSLRVAQIPFPEDTDLNYDEAGLQTAMQNSVRQFLQKSNGTGQSKIGAVVALSEDATIAAWRVLQAMPPGNRPRFFGVSVDPDLLNACRKGEIAALVVQNPHQIGALSVQAITQFIDGGQRPQQQVFVPYQIMHAGN